MSKLKLGVLFGGRSSEYSVSLHSAGSFLRALDKDLYDLEMIGIDQEGNFYLYEGSIEDLEHDHWKNHARPATFVHKGVFDLERHSKKDLDVCFPILHGKNGEDGCIQGLFELMNIKYVGCDVTASADCMDKEVMHILLAAAGIPAAQYICLRDYEPIPDFEEVEKKIPLPWVIKPCNAGSSYGVSFVNNREDYQKAVEEAFFYDGRGKILVEKAIDGFEIGCAVMGNETLFAGAVDEIQTSHPVFDFEGKYEMVDSAIYCPARISQEKTAEAQDLAKKIYRALGCRGMARVDMFLCTDGTIVCNEVNTIPGMTATSRYPTMMKEAGLDFTTLINKLIALALETSVSNS